MYTQDPKMQSQIVIPFNYSYAAALSVNVAVPSPGNITNYRVSGRPEQPRPHIVHVPSHTPVQSPLSPPATATSFPGMPPEESTSPTSLKSFSIEAILGLKQTTSHLQCAAGSRYYPYRIPGFHHKLAAYYSNQNRFAGTLDSTLALPSEHVNSEQQKLQVKNRQNAKRHQEQTEAIGYVQKQHQFNPECLESRTKDKLLSDGGAGKSGKAKRIRTIFTPEQLERLEAEFERQQYMVGTERLYLASELQLTEAQVKVWFQNRRIKWRKQHLEIQHAKLAQLGLLSGQQDEYESESDSEIVSEQE